MATTTDVASEAKPTPTAAPSAAAVASAAVPPARVLGTVFAPERRLGSVHRLYACSRLTLLDVLPCVCVCAVPTEGPELENALLRQIEYYFSPQNLTHDRYLLSQMDPETYVLIEVIANFHKVKLLSTDLSFITSVLQKSTALQLDESRTKVRAAVRQQRTTVVLRDMPATTTAQVSYSLLRALSLSLSLCLSVSRGAACVVSRSRELSTNSRERHVS